MARSGSSPSESHWEAVTALAVASQQRGANIQHRCHGQCLAGCVFPQRLPALRPRHTLVLTDVLKNKTAFRGPVSSEISASTRRLLVHVPAYRVWGLLPRTGPGHAVTTHSHSGLLDHRPVFSKDACETPHPTWTAVAETAFQRATRIGPPECWF